MRGRVLPRGKKASKMKPIEDQTHYEILEVRPGATPMEIQKAYERAKETFDEESLAIYSLFSEKDLVKIRSAIEVAYQALMKETMGRSPGDPHVRSVRSDLEPVSIASSWGVPRGTGAPSPPPPSALCETVRQGDGDYRGRTLKRIRQRMGMDLKTLSAVTKINRKTLESIEAEKVDQLPPLVYLKGFLKAYAQCLCLDPQRVVEAYLKFLPRDKGPP